MVNDKHLLFSSISFLTCFCNSESKTLTDFWLTFFSEFTILILFIWILSLHFNFIIFTTDLKNKNKNLSQFRLFLSKFEDYILQYLWLLSQNSKFLTELQEKKPELWNINSKLPRVRIVRIKNKNKKNITVCIYFLSCGRNRFPYVIQTENKQKIK